MSKLYKELTDHKLTDKEIESLLAYASDVEDKKDIHREPDGFMDNDGKKQTEFSDIQFCVVDNSINNSVVTKITKWIDSNADSMQFAWIDSKCDYHKEPRKCCLMIPLLDTPSPLKFVNSSDFSKELGSYTFSKGVPVLIDTDYTHFGDRDNKTPQQFFQLNFMTAFETVSSWYDE